MTWRRFTQGSFGGLSARQYTEVQDAVAAMLARLPARGTPDVYAGRPILVRIKEKVGSSVQSSAGSVPGSTRLAGQVYKFAQVHVRLSGEGQIEIAERPYGLKSQQPEGMTEDAALYAIDMTPGSNLALNTLATVYPVDVDLGADRNAVPPRQGLYVLMQGQQQESVGVYTITGYGGARGQYFARLSTDTGSEPSQLTNLYETNEWYGALTPPLNPCATVTPGALRIADTVFGFTFNGSLYTCAPTRFIVECVDCGTNPGGALAPTYATPAKESAAASVMLGG